MHLSGRLIEKEIGHLLRKQVLEGWKNTTINLLVKQGLKEWLGSKEEEKKLE